YQGARDSTESVEPRERGGCARSGSCFESSGGFGGQQYCCYWRRSSLHYPRAIEVRLCAVEFCEKRGREFLRIFETKSTCGARIHNELSSHRRLPTSIRARTFSTARLTLTRFGSITLPAKIPPPVQVWYFPDTSVLRKS